MSMVQLIFSTKSKTSFKNHLEGLAKVKDKVEDSFKNVFTSNNRNLINKFFQDDLVKELWKIYLRDSHSHKEYIRQLKRTNEAGFLLL